MVLHRVVVAMRALGIVAVVSLLGAACAGPDAVPATPDAAAPPAVSTVQVIPRQGYGQAGGAPVTSEAVLNEPPTFMGPTERLATDPKAARLADLSALAPRSADDAGGLRINTRDRDEVIQRYKDIYLASDNAAASWSGSTQTCSIGTIAASYREAMRQRVNYFRAMTGQVGRVRFDPLLSHKAQQAALMMHAKNALNHTPDPSWPCYTADGAAAAGSSNLYGMAGPAAITGYMVDPGAGNSAVGHRRWILYPPTQEMGVGDTGKFNALWVIGGFGDRPAQPVAVAWPPPGFVPYPLAFNRWSYSYPGADFAQAKVTMTRDGRPVPLQVVYQQEDGFGDPTIVWEPAGLPLYPQPQSLGRDQVFTIKIDGFSAQDGTTSATYRVTLIDPDALQIDTITPTPTGTAAATATTATATATATVAGTGTRTPTVTATRAIATSTRTMTPKGVTPPTPTTPPPSGPTRTPVAPTPTMTPAPAGPVPVECPNLRAPADAIRAALANPDSIKGWGTLCNPNAPHHPLYNGYRTSLTLSNRNIPYNPLNNSLEFKCGCN